MEPTASRAELWEQKISGFVCCDTRKGPCQGREPFMECEAAKDNTSLQNWPIVHWSTQYVSQVHVQFATDLCIRHVPKWCMFMHAMKNPCCYHICTSNPFHGETILWMHCCGLAWCGKILPSAAFIMYVYKSGHTLTFDFKTIWFGIWTLIFCEEVFQIFLHNGCTSVIATPSVMDHWNLLPFGNMHGGGLASSYDRSTRIQYRKFYIPTFNTHQVTCKSCVCFFMSFFCGISCLLQCTCKDHPKVWSWLYFTFLQVTCKDTSKGHSNLQQCTCCVKTWTCPCQTFAQCNPNLPSTFNQHFCWATHMYSRLPGQECLWYFPIPHQWWHPTHKTQDTSMCIQALNMARQHLRHWGGGCNFVQAWKVIWTVRQPFKTSSKQVIITQTWMLHSYWLNMHAATICHMWVKCHQAHHQCNMLPFILHQPMNNKHNHPPNHVSKQCQARFPTKVIHTHFQNYCVSPEPKKQLQ